MLTCNAQIKKILLITIFLFVVNTGMEQKLDFFQYCTYMNYPVQSHIIMTSDGYYLQYYRVQKKGTQISNLNTVVLMQHGLVDSSDTFIYNDQHLAPGLILANQGYDVWFGNSRGNKYSNKALSPKVLNYWDFSFEEMAQLDLPAAFKYINQKTQKKIHYIGHSQGTLIMFIALSLQLQDVQSRLASFSALGPVVYVNQVESKMMKILVKANLPKILQSSGAQEVLFLPRSIGFQLSLGCKVDPQTCKSTLFAISQKNNSVNNIERMPVILRHFPSGTSTKDFIHFSQYLKKDIFCKFDYGKKGNLKKYGTQTPPKYDLSKINFPVHLFVGQYDRLATVNSAKRIFNELTNSEGKTMKVYKYGHATFIWGKSNQAIQDVINVIKNNSKQVFQQ